MAARKFDYVLCIVPEAFSELFWRSNSLTFFLKVKVAIIFFSMETTKAL